MKTIWKYKLKPLCTLDMPVGAEVLSAREQGNDICIWALVDPEALLETRSFGVFGTGHSVPDVPLKFLGTAHLENSALVFHAFEFLAAKPLVIPHA